MLINAYIENYNKYWNERKFRVSFTSITDSRISQYIFNDSNYTADNEPEEIKDKGAMVLFILKRDQEELNHVKKLID